jgi:Zn-dependent peptidase ImmA (M78 family)
LFELYELDEIEPEVAWSVELHGNDEQVARSARELLLGSSAHPGRSADAYTHLNFWSGRLEELGVMVHSTAGGDVSVKEMRAFSLYFDVLPVVVLNGADAAKGRAFSLLHEFSHLLLRTGGLCDTTAEEGSRTPDRRIEAQCNRIAAGILMPEAAVRRNSEVLARRDESSWDYESLRNAGASFGVSAEAFCRRLATLGLVSGGFYQDRRSDFLAAYEAEEEVRSVPGGNWYRNKSRDLGKGYVRDVASAWHRRVIDSASAARYLDAKVSQIPKLAEAAGLAGMRR